MWRLKCRYCGHIFDEENAKTRTEYMDYEGHWYEYYTVMLCPECGDECIDDYYESEDEEDENTDEL